MSGGATPAEAAPAPAAAGVHRWGLRLRLGLLFAALAAAVPLALAAGLWLGFAHLADPAAALIQSAIVAGLVLLAAVAGLWFLFDEHLGRALLRLAGLLRSIAHADAHPGEGAVEAQAEALRYLGDAAPAALALAGRMARVAAERDAAVARETRRLALEKERLEGLLSDVPDAVLLLSCDHRLAFYNGPAVTLLAGPSGTAPALGQSLFDHLRAPPVSRAYDRLLASGDPEGASDLLCATSGGVRLLTGRMRLIDDGQARPGYALTLRDLSSDPGATERLRSAQRQQDLRQSASALQTGLSLLQEALHEAGPGEGTAQVLAALVAESDRLATRLQARQPGEGPAAGLPETRAFDLADAVAARMKSRGIDCAVEVAELMLSCDGAQMLGLLDALGRHVAAQGGTGLALGIVQDWAGALIRLGWQGVAPDLAELERWLEEPSGGGGGLPGRRVLELHGSECWAEVPEAGRAALVVPVRHARLAPSPSAGEGVVPGRQGVVYDFALLAAEMRGDADLDALPLERLAFAVFDTETTGLDPRNDEVVQIAALRIVNSRIVRRESFETLVDPGRPIPPRATAVHGISQQMVEGAPGMVEAGRQFHAFVRGAVLVAHNAPFDLQFFRRHAGAIQREFDQPVLDTVLLSAEVFGRDARHDLDSLSHRLGVTIPEARRHTAMGDTEATAEVFLRLLPMLRAKGIVTFGQARAAMRRHGRLLADPNGPAK